MDNVLPLQLTAYQGCTIVQASGLKLQYYNRRLLFEARLAALFDMLLSCWLTPHALLKTDW